MNMRIVGKVNVFDPRRRDGTCSMDGNGSVKCDAEVDMKMSRYLAA